MGYYTGDPGYYAGDPGIFGFLGNLLKPVIGGVVGTVTGGPIGGIIGALKGTSSAVRTGTQVATLAAGGGGSAYTPAMKARHAEVLARGGVGTIARGGLAMQGQPGMAMRLAGAPGFNVRRMHWNRSTYVTRGGGTSRWPVGLAIHPKGTEPVPSRRMNVANPRALRRGIRRLRGFAKLARKVLAVARHYKKTGVTSRARKPPARR
jgi:hypothetical protein